MNEGDVRKALENKPLGLTLKALRAAVPGDSASNQTVLRLLRKMESAGQLRFEGNTRARRYVLAESVERRASLDDAVGVAQGVALSPESGEVLRLLEPPVSARPPVSYRRQFLDDYVPGVTQYLPTALRAHLASRGRTAEERQPAGTYARKVLERFLLDLSWNSSRLEGNTYSLLDTERLLASGARVEGKSATEAQMLINHKAAIEMLIGEPGAPAKLDERMLKTLHALLMENLLGNPRDEGGLRSTPVSISGSAYLPLANPQLIDECFRQVVLTALRVDDPFERSFFLLVHLPYLQPFIDGNKRVSRLAANVPLIERNLVPLSFVDVPPALYQRATLAVYEFNRFELLRDLYVWSYERSAARLGQVRTALGEPDTFRLEHRMALRAAVAQVVRALLPRSAWRAELTRFAELHVPSAVARFVAAAEVDLENLNEVTSSRYGFRPSEFTAWASVRDAE